MLVLKDRDTKGDETRELKLRQRDLERNDLSARDEAIEKKVREHEKAYLVRNWTYKAYLVLVF